jgi:hypothetical protein
MGPRNAYKDMLDNVVSPITCVSMNHQTQLEQMANGAIFATTDSIGTRSTKGMAPRSPYHRLRGRGRGETGATTMAAAAVRAPASGSAVPPIGDAGDEGFFSRFFLHYPEMNVLGGPSHRCFASA